MSFIGSSLLLAAMVPFLTLLGATPSTQPSVRSSPMPHPHTTGVVRCDVSSRPSCVKSRGGGAPRARGGDRIGQRLGAPVQLQVRLLRPPRSGTRHPNYALGRRRLLDDRGAGLSGVKYYWALPARNLEKGGGARSGSETKLLPRDPISTGLYAGGLTEALLGPTPRPFLLPPRPPSEGPKRPALRRASPLDGRFSCCCSVRNVTCVMCVCVCLCL